jgi:hypothetical protein
VKMETKAAPYAQLGSAYQVPSLVSAWGGTVLAFNHPVTVIDINPFHSVS